MFVPERCGLNRGMPASYYVSPPLKQIVVGGNEPPPVWPDPEDEDRGESFSPLYRSAPEAAKKDESLFELLALVGALRGGWARERELAAGELKMRLDQYT